MVLSFFSVSLLLVFPSLTPLPPPSFSHLFSLPPFRGQVGGKESLLYFGCWHQRGKRGEEHGCLSKAQLPPSDIRGARAFAGGGRGLHAETAVSSDSHLD